MSSAAESTHRATQSRAIFTPRSASVLLNRALSTGGSASEQIVFIATICLSQGPTSDHFAMDMSSDNGGSGMNNPTHTMKGGRSRKRKRSNVQRSCEEVSKQVLDMAGSFHRDFTFSCPRPSSAGNLSAASVMFSNGPLFPCRS